MKNCNKCNAQLDEAAEVCSCGQWFRVSPSLGTAPLAPTGRRGPMPLWQPSAAIAAAVVSTVMAQSYRTFGTKSALGLALSNSTVAFDLIVPAILVVLMFPAANVGVASLLERFRTPASRRSIFFWWGVGITIVQLYSYFAVPVVAAA